jgi:hypothetical protein
MGTTWALPGGKRLHAFSDRDDLPEPGGPPIAIIARRS